MASCSKFGKRYKVLCGTVRRAYILDTSYFYQGLGVFNRFNSDVCICGFISDVFLLLYHMFYWH